LYSAPSYVGEISCGQSHSGAAPFTDFVKGAGFPLERRQIENFRERNKKTAPLKGARVRHPKFTECGRRIERGELPK
jgi:hypothetical protein